MGRCWLKKVDEKEGGGSFQANFQKKSWVYGRRRAPSLQETGWMAKLYLPGSMLVTNVVLGAEAGQSVAGFGVEGLISHAA
jgi:hypothetical protein